MSNSLTRVTPQFAWDEMANGNARFVQGGPQHPRQDVERRSELGNGQAPNAALFGCSDSRLSAEIIFDRGLGDLFVARNMGHIVAESVVASMEYAVSELGIALIVVLAHDSCGAVGAAIKLSTSTPPTVPQAVENVLQPLLPSVQQLWLRDHSDTPYVNPALLDADEVGRLHLTNTVGSLLRASRIISDAVAAGTLGIVGCQYRLTAGRAVPVTAVGPVNVQLADPAEAAHADHSAATAH